MKLFAYMNMKTKPFQSTTLKYIHFCTVMSHVYNIYVHIHLRLIQS